MSDSIFTVSQRVIILTSLLSLIGCSSPLDPLNGMRSPQRKELFLKRYPVPENSFVANGGLAKKSDLPHFIKSIDSSGVYTANPRFRENNGKANTYKDPLSNPYHNMYEENQAQRQKGESSSIVSFFKNGYKKAKNWFTNETSNQETQNIKTHNTQSQNNDSSDDPSGEHEGEGDIMAEQMQGGGSSLGYSYYDLADDIAFGEVEFQQPAQSPQSNMLSQVKTNNKSHKVIKTYNEILKNNTPSAHEPERLNAYAEENQLQNIGVIYSHSPEKTEFDEYYIMQNKKPSMVKSLFNKYVKKISSIMSINEANAAEIDEQVELNQEEFDKMNDLKPPIITEEDSQNAKKSYPDLKDVPNRPDIFQNPSRYRKQIERLKQETS